MDRYEIVDEKIGKGGYGTAKLIRPKYGNQLLVMKEMKYCQAALQEAQILQSIDHPLIVKYVDHFQHGDKFCIIMEYAERGNLRQMMNNLGNTEVLISIFPQICSAVRIIHDKNIIHRDLKPENIFLTNNKERFCFSTKIKLGDFGIAKILQNQNDKAKTRIGTEGYEAPEVLLGLEYDKKADIWSLGCILYELLTLRQPSYHPNFDLIEDFSLKYLLMSMLSINPDLRPTIEIVQEKYSKIHMAQCIKFSRRIVSCVQKAVKTIKKH